jgi:hypothetical protein
MSEQHRIVILKSGEAVLAIDRGDEGIFPYSTASAVINLLEAHLIEEYGKNVRKEDLPIVSMYINAKVQVEVQDGQTKQSKTGTVVGVIYRDNELRFKVKFRQGEIDSLDFAMSQITLKESIQA